MKRGRSPVSISDWGSWENDDVCGAQLGYVWSGGGYVWSEGGGAVYTNGYVIDTFYLALSHILCPYLSLTHMLSFSLMCTCYI